MEEYILEIPKLKFSKLVLFCWLLQQFERFQISFKSCYSIPIVIYTPCIQNVKFLSIRTPVSNKSNSIELPFEILGNFYKLWTEILKDLKFFLNFKVFLVYVMKITKVYFLGKLRGEKPRRLQSKDEWIKTKTRRWSVRHAKIKTKNYSENQKTVQHLSSSFSSNVGLRI